MNKPTEIRFADFPIRVLGFFASLLLRFIDYFVRILIALGDIF
jgi:hypothetical protein